MIHGWPIHHANIGLVVLTGVIFLAAYSFKAWGWQRLFSRDRRPAMVTLAAAGGAASVGGIALPGRFDELLRIAVVRRCRRPRVSLGAVAFSLFLLGLIDSAALVPLASVAAGVIDVSGAGRAALIVVAAVGVVAAGVVLALPRLVPHPAHRPLPRRRLDAGARDGAARRDRGVGGDRRFLESARAGALRPARGARPADELRARHRVPVRVVGVGRASDRARGRGHPGGRGCSDPRRGRHAPRRGDRLRRRRAGPRDRGRRSLCRRDGRVARGRPPAALAPSGSSAPSAGGLGGLAGAEVEPLRAGVRPHVGARRLPLAPAARRPPIGAEQIGASLYELGAGEQSFPYHFHHGIEEWLLVVYGTPTVRTPDGERVLRRGDVVCFPTGPAGAHQVRGPGTVLILSAKRLARAVEYPDSGKLGARPPGKNFRAPTRRTTGRARVSEPVNLYDVAPRATPPIRPAIATGGAGRAAIGAAQLGASVYELDPGESVCPYHYERRRRSGCSCSSAGRLSAIPTASTSWPGRSRLLPGRPGRRTQGDQPLGGPVRIAMLSTRAKTAMAVYPDSDKVGVWPLGKLFRIETPSTTGTARSEPQKRAFDGR